jgi:steroid delta-isomerase-like uncharacterized protein
MSGVATTSAQTDTSNGDLVRRLFDLLNAQDVARLREYWTDDTVDRFPDRTCRGADEIAAYFESAFVAFPDWHMDVVALVEQGEEVFVRWRLTGTQRGPLMGVAPTGRRLMMDGIDHFVVRDGKVASAFVVFDQLGYARQLGLLPPQGSPFEAALKMAFNGAGKLVRRIRR